MMRLGNEVSVQREKYRVNKVFYYRVAIETFEKRLRGTSQGLPTQIQTFNARLRLSRNSASFFSIYSLLLFLKNPL